MGIRHTINFFVVYFISTVLTFLPYSPNNSVGPDQTSHSAASDLGLQDLPKSLVWDAGHKWIKSEYLSVSEKFMQSDDSVRHLRRP